MIGKRLGWPVLAIACCIVAGFEARGDVITVAPDGSGDFLTIQEGIDAAGWGDIVEVGPGVYNDASTREINGELEGANVFLKSGVTVRGAGPGESIIAVNDQDLEVGSAGILAIDVENGILEGFTITGYIDWGEEHYQYYGTALAAENSELTITGNIFDSYIVHPEDPALSGCQFFGTMIYLTGGSSSLIGNNLFLYADDVYLSVNGGAATIFNNTFAGDPGQIEAAGVGGQEALLEVRNNIFAWIEDAVGLWILGDDEGSTLTLSNNCYWQVEETLHTNGPGNEVVDEGGDVEGNPNFALVDLPHGNYDFRPVPPSPCIDAGSDEVPGWLPDVDLWGIPRVLDGDGDGIAVIEIGAYEYPCPAEIVIELFGAGDNKGNTDPLEDIRFLRDTFLAGNAKGRRLIESYRRFSGELTFILLENPALGKRTYFSLYHLGTDLGRMVKYGDPRLSPLHPLNLKLVSQETVDQGLALIAQFKKCASKELAKELIALEEIVMKGSGEVYSEGGLDPVRTKRQRVQSLPEEKQGHGNEGQEIVNGVHE